MSLFFLGALACAEVDRPAKLYYIHGVVNSAKTLALLAVAHKYEAQGKKVIVMKPEIDERFGKKTVASRAGLSREADIIVSPHAILDFDDFAGCRCVLVDEAQFLSAHVVEQLRALANSGVPVICYGLRTDFRLQSFEGSRRLFELADTIDEIKTPCYRCDRKAIFNLKHVGGVPTLAGPQVALGGEEMYLAVCSRHYRESTAGSIGG